MWKIGEKEILNVKLSVSSSVPHTLDIRIEEIPQPDHKKRKIMK